MSTHVQVHDEVANALQSRAGVVLLETAVLTRGLPHTPWQSSYGPCPPVIDTELPIHLATVQSMAAAIRSSGAVPAITAVINGTPRVGLTEEELHALAQDTQAGKASTPTLSLAMATGSSAGTTVSGTLRLSGSLASMGLLQPRVFATGGIGGVHRGAAETLDISQDLTALGRQGIAVICSGAKSILDLPKTLEVLESQGVPVIGYGTNNFPAFYARACGLTVEQHADGPEDAAQLLKCHSELGVESSVVIANPIAEEFAIPWLELDAWTAQAEIEAAANGVSGKAITPYLLKRIGELSKGRTLAANQALATANAGVAARIGVALSRLSTQPDSA